MKEQVFELVAQIRLDGGVGKLEGHEQPLTSTLLICCEVQIFWPDICVAKRRREMIDPR